MPRGIYIRTEETRKRMSEAQKGKHLSEETKKKLSEARKVENLSEDTRKKISEAQRGSKNHNWRGGIASKKRLIRKGLEYRLWREAVFARDNFTCQKTGVRGCKLEAHHICNFADYPELRTSIENGITLSKKAHREFHKKYGQRNNTKEQIEEFLEGKISF